MSGLYHWVGYFKIYQNQSFTNIYILIINQYFLEKKRDLLIKKDFLYKYLTFIWKFVLYSIKIRNYHDFRYKNIILIITPILIRILKNKLDSYNIYIIKFHCFKFYKIIFLNKESVQLCINEFCIYFEVVHSVIWPTRC